MTRDDVLSMAREAGFEVHDRKQQARVGLDALIGIDSTKKLERFAALAAEHERTARIAAQTENEALKARLAGSGVAERRAVRAAVLAEREAFAKELDAMADEAEAEMEPSTAVAHFRARAAAIRARGAA